MIYAIIYISVTALGLICAGIYCTAKDIRDDEQFITCGMMFAWPLILPLLFIMLIGSGLYKFGEWIWNKYQDVKLRHK